MVFGKKRILFQKAFIAMLADIPPLTQRKINSFIPVR
jgi:hypothetical protein